LKALPPLHLVAAGIDPLLSDSIAFANRLAGLGRAERLHIVPGVVHGFLQMSLLLPEARAVLADAGAFIRAHA
jgi:acetyl esterase